MNLNIFCVKQSVNLIDSDNLKAFMNGLAL